MRITVENTLKNSAPVVRMVRQRQNTSTSEGNRNGGKNSDANCQIAATVASGMM